MSEQGIQIIRLVIAGVNGLMFAVGIYILLEHLKFRPDRWKRRLKWLIAEAEKDEIAADPADGSTENASEKRREIEELQRMLRDHLRNPQTLLNIGFGILIVAVAVFALLNLINPTFSMFM